MLGSAFLRLCSLQLSYPHRTTPPQINHLQTVDLPLFHAPAVAFSDWAKAKGEIFAACDLSGFLKAHYSLLGSAAPPRGVEQSPVVAACWVAADLGESYSFLYLFLFLFPLPLPLTFLRPFHRVSLCSYFNKAFFPPPSLFLFLAQAVQPLRRPKQVLTKMSK